MKTYFEIKPADFTSSKSENVFLSIRFGLGVVFKKTQGLFRKIAIEGVCFISIRWIPIR